MKLSKTFAHNEQDHVYLCMNADGRPVLATDEFVVTAVSDVFDDTHVILTDSNDVVVPGYSANEPFKRINIQLKKYIIDGQYVCRYGVGRVNGQRIIVSDGNLERLPEPPK